MNSEEACAVLGVVPGCDRQTLKKAYQRKVRYWHPDNFISSTEVLPEMKEFAAGQMRRVIEAFTLLADANEGPEPTEDSDVPHTLSSVYEATEVYLLVQQIQNLTHRLRGMSERIQGLSDGLDDLTVKVEQIKYRMEKGF